jgi:hypothetical protein
MDGVGLPHGNGRKWWKYGVFMARFRKQNDHGEILNKKYFLIFGQKKSLFCRFFVKFWQLGKSAGTGWKGANPTEKGQKIGKIGVFLARFHEQKESP